MEETKNVAADELKEKITNNRKIREKYSPSILAYTRLVLIIAFIVSWINGDKVYGYFTIAAVSYAMEYVLKYKETKDKMDLFECIISVAATLLGIMSMVDKYIIH